MDMLLLNAVIVLNYCTFHPYLGKVSESLGPLISKRNIFSLPLYLRLALIKSLSLEVYQSISLHLNDMIFEGLTAHLITV